jgi:hypothetical protein
MTNEPQFCENTFYNLSKKCWFSAEEVFLDSQFAFLEELLESVEPIIISLTWDDTNVMGLILILVDSVSTQR